MQTEISSIMLWKKSLSYMSTCYTLFTVSSHEVLCVKCSLYTCRKPSLGLKHTIVSDSRDLKQNFKVS